MPLAQHRFRSDQRWACFGYICKGEFSGRRIQERPCLADTLVFIQKVLAWKRNRCAFASAPLAEEIAHVVRMYDSSARHSHTSGRNGHSSEPGLFSVERTLKRLRLDVDRQRAVEKTLRHTFAKEKRLCAAKDFEPLKASASLRLEELQAQMQDPPLQLHTAAHIGVRFQRRWRPCRSCRPAPVMSGAGVQVLRLASLQPAQTAF